MAPQLRGGVALAEDLLLPSSLRDDLQLCSTSAQGIRSPLLTSAGSRHAHVGTHLYIHVAKRLKHVQSK